MVAAVAAVAAVERAWALCGLVRLDRWPPPRDEVYATAVVPVATNNALSVEDSGSEVRRRRRVGRPRVWAVGERGGDHGDAETSARPCVWY